VRVAWTFASANSAPSASGVPARLLVRTVTGGDSLFATSIASAPSGP
jgi:hypothetical protein